MLKSDALLLTSTLQSCVILHEFAHCSSQLIPTAYIKALFPNVKPREYMIYSWTPTDASRLHLYGYDESHHNGSSYNDVRESVVVDQDIANEIGAQIRDRALSFAKQHILDEEARANNTRVQKLAEAVLRGLLED